MERWATTLVGLAAVVLAVWLVARGYHAPTRVGHDPDSRADGGEPENAGAPMYALSAAGATAAGDDAGPLLLPDLAPAATDRRADAGAGVAMPDGTPVPPLSFSAPREVRFGVVLVSYAGAQPSAGGGKPSGRSRADAKVLAAKLLATAGQDFHAAVQQGDAGSADDVGRVKRGVLEPAPEYLLFSMGVDSVAGPVDTPRGYWIVKRLE
jgi:hypothetical protein